MELFNSSVSRKVVDALPKFLPLLAFIVPITILYFLDPVVFEKTWKGRMFDVFFLWLVSLEIILNWEGLKVEKIKKTISIRTGAFVVALSLPTLYVIISSFYGLSTIIGDFALQGGMGAIYADTMAFTMEYLVFAIMFSAIILLEYGFHGLKTHLISPLFLTAIWAIYMIDNLSSGNFTPFQILVPATSSLASNFLNFLGYTTTMGSATDFVPTLTVHGLRWFSAQIGWPCSGIESLLIYSVTILLFLRYSGVSWSHGIVYFVFGAVFTYFINVLRIVNIFIIGADGGNIWPFHDIYGQLYSISWIAFYPLLIMLSQTFLERKGR